MKLKKDVKCSTCGTWLCKCCNIRYMGKTWCLDCLADAQFREIIEMFIPKKKPDPDPGTSFLPSMNNSKKKINAGDLPHE